MSLKNSISQDQFFEYFSCCSKILATEMTPEASREHWREWRQALAVLFVTLDKKFQGIKDEVRTVILYFHSENFMR
jgi:hypothetical protein